MSEYLFTDYKYYKGSLFCEETKIIVRALALLTLFCHTYGTYTVDISFHTLSDFKCSVQTSKTKLISQVAPLL